jgi:hypothetical protein
MVRASMVLMDPSRLAFLLLVYVTLDFANPLMPGAVHFEGGSVDAVQADRARPVTPAAPVSLQPSPEPVIDRVAYIRAPDRPSPIPEPRRYAVTRIRRAPAPSADPPAGSEDH